MTVHRVRGPAGAEVTLEVPGSGLTEEQFNKRVESGEYTLLDQPAKPEHKTEAKSPAKRGTRPKK